MKVDLSGSRILVVEDEYLVAALIQDVLENAGCTVHGPVPRLAEAIEVAEKEACDAAVLDINLSGQHVFAVAEILERRRIPYVFVTGYGLEALPPRHHGYPAIRKPFRNEDLLNAIAGLMTRFE
jgi:CheY-like chemotaxis protein